MGSVGPFFLDQSGFVNHYLINNKKSHWDGPVVAPCGFSSQQPTTIDSANIIELCEVEQGISLRGEYKGVYEGKMAPLNDFKTRCDPL